MIFQGISAQLVRIIIQRTSLVLGYQCSVCRSLKNYSFRLLILAPKWTQHLLVSVAACYTHCPPDISLRLAATCLPAQPRWDTGLRSACLWSQNSCMLAKASHTWVISAPEMEENANRAEKRNDQLTLQCWSGMVHGFFRNI